MACPASCLSPSPFIRQLLPTPTPFLTASCVALETFIFKAEAIHEAFPEANQICSSLTLTHGEAFIQGSSLSSRDHPLKELIECWDCIRSLVDKANDWLRKTSDVQIKSCESITWSACDPKKLGDSEQMVLTNSVTENGSTHFIRGLRLWLAPKPGCKAQVLGFTDFCPEGSDTIQSLINRVNVEIDRGTLKGRILSLETISAPVVNGNVECSETRWQLSANEDKPHAFCLRVFFCKQANIMATHIGVQDFVPFLGDEGYQGFSDLVERANSWLKGETDIRVTNMQSVMVQKNDGPHSETGSAAFYVIPGINCEHPRESFRILRVAFAKISPSEDGGDDMNICPFSYENFTPEIVTPRTDLKPKERMEKMKETFAKASSFLRSSGMDLICAETVMNPMQFVGDDDSAHNDEFDDDEIKLLLTIRLYVNGSSNYNHDGNSKQLISLRDVGSRRKFSEEDHPGPIFLSRVVTRNYKYRWAVLAGTIFTCMTIIVVVSVVYSNQ
ncbi:hypothetical protein CAPTEDRAFT_193210 [Capitella teleta]|uniref:Uncharacterized protein n=1 Tax=Capitella teleta TaxID=283909 RepID=R7TJ12_CAPTE|nr:hypothetical protein CAPTEDRAFT_193210 [Capitella teleta]|eukprot:ELT91536.1 hypothetical protein CAPTEDRAFT_193210 [Capitella teleta]